MRPEARETPSGFFTPREAAVLEALAARIVHSGVPDAPTVQQAHVFQTADRFVLGLEPQVQRQLRWALRLFHYSPPFFGFGLKTFLGLSAAQRDTYLHSWATSRLTVRRIAYRALRNLVMLGYYDHEATWPLVDYRPWPRSRRGSP